MKSFNTVLLVTALSTGLVLASSPSDASTATASIGVSALVASGCTITALPLAFGAYTPSSSTPLSGSTSVTVICTIGTPYNVGLDAGVGSGATVTTRQMTIVGGGSNEMAYSLYQDSGHSTVWGNTINTNTVSGTYALGQPALTVYGQIPASQNVPAGIYSDTITATITY